MTRDHRRLAAIDRPMWWACEWMQRVGSRRSLTGQLQTVSVAAKFAQRRPFGLAPFGWEARAKWSGPTDYRNPVFQFFAVADYQDAALRMSGVPIIMIFSPPFAWESATSVPVFVEYRTPRRRAKNPLL